MEIKKIQNKTEDESESSSSSDRMEPGKRKSWTKFKGGEKIRGERKEKEGKKETIDKLKKKVEKRRALFFFILIFVLVQKINRYLHLLNAFFEKTEQRPVQIETVRNSLFLVPFCLFSILCRSCLFSFLIL